MEESNETKLTLDDVKQDLYTQLKAMDASTEGYTAAINSLKTAAEIEKIEQEIEAAKVHTELEIEDHEIEIKKKEEPKQIDVFGAIKSIDPRVVQTVISAATQLIALSTVVKLENSGQMVHTKGINWLPRI